MILNCIELAIYHSPKIPPKSPLKTPQIPLISSPCPKNKNLSK